MSKILLALALSVTFIVCGWFFALNEGSLSITTTLPHIYYDIDNTCDNDSYLTHGRSRLENSQLERFKRDLAKEVKSHKNNDNFLTIKAGQSLYGILAAKGVSSQEIHELSKTLAPFVRPSDISAGNLYKFQLGPKTNNRFQIESFYLRRKDQNRVSITYEIHREVNKNNQPAFQVEIKRPRITYKLTLVKLSVKGTLFRSFMKISFGNELMQRLLSVLTWKLDVPQEVSNSDMIEILVEQKYADQEFIGYGQIKEIRYQKPQRTLIARYFSSTKESVSGYYDEEGHSIEKEFLVSPVLETTATSNQKWRFHPVRKTRIRHNGIDFRGTIGTPFFSLADGKVIEKRFDKNVGNMIRIKHKYGIYSEYFHASALNDELRVGSSVMRGQKIGEIGRSGKLCTGPHLHMGLYTHFSGKKKFIGIRSLKNKLKDAPNLSDRDRDDFFAYTEHLASIKESIEKEELLDASEIAAVSN